MERVAEAYLNEWFTGKIRKPLVIRGARQVGKSTLVRNFAEKSRLILHEINLEKNLLLDSVFRRLNVTEIVGELELAAGKGILVPKGSLIFLDEIQSLPSVFPVLRYLHEERPDIPVVAAGSLLEFALSKTPFSMPVGRIEYLYLGPMSFQEFLLAQNEAGLLDYLRNYHLAEPPSTVNHEKLLGRLREYLLVGGMPEAVKVFSGGAGFEGAFKAHESIFETYKDDFSKYASGDELIRLQKMFTYLPSVVGEKMKFSNIDATEKAPVMRKIAELLARAGIFYPVAHSSCSGLPLQAGADDRRFKPLFLDVGLMNGIRGVRVLPVEKMMTRIFLNEGKMAEQFAGQHLLYLDSPGRKPSLNYWVREERDQGAEVDYVIQVGDGIIPVEVKAGLSGSLKSLQQFVFQKKSGLCLRADQNPPSILDAAHDMTSGDHKRLIRYRLLSIPLYMIEQSVRLIDEALKF